MYENKKNKYVLIKSRAPSYKLILFCSDIFQSTNILFMVNVDQLSKIGKRNCKRELGKLMFSGKIENLFTLKLLS